MAVFNEKIIKGRHCCMGYGEEELKFVYSLKKQIIILNLLI